MHHHCLWGHPEQMAFRCERPSKLDVIERNWKPLIHEMTGRKVRRSERSLRVATSTGATGNTPLGTWHVYRKVGGFDWVLYYPSYFLRGFAVHGYPDVPPYPASHGCARIPMWIAQTVYAQIGYGSTVYVYQ